MLVSNATNQGDRPYQEDYHAYYTPPKGLEERGTLLLLADGMGGMAGGATASLLAVESFKNAYYAPDQDQNAATGVSDRLARILPEVNAALLAASQADINLTGMGTTLIAAVIAGNKLHWVSIGDSHLYLLHDGALRLLSEDHSVGAEVERRRQAGTITEEYAKTFEGQHHKLMHYLGDKNFAHFDVSTKPEELWPDDRVVMCSDGLYGTLPEAEMTRLLLESDPTLSANVLVDAALARQAQGQDNLTVQVVSIRDDETAMPKGHESMRSKSWPLVWGAALLLCAASGYWYWTRHSTPPPTDARPAAAAVATPSLKSVRAGAKETPRAQAPAVAPSRTSGSTPSTANLPPPPAAK